jgi:hypothetical protein
MASHISHTEKHIMHSIPSSMTGIMTHISSCCKKITYIQQEKFNEKEDEITYRTKNCEYLAEDKIGHCCNPICL